ncbi:uncharacterized protein DUF547 [Maribacter vaceletii]|uniref:Uncharacterized protein DUF547 n=1 Tax=Maribacter vaceletii TaxID=1206816 RepID=A0A495DWF1_9FLAO|nr:DUF547 domain-containing protein [Maribacter vaceletii]RKR07937.1 uncharacterized protein DUF547 [Maribacter vaceletii]
MNKLQSKLLLLFLTIFCFYTSEASKVNTGIVKVDYNKLSEEFLNCVKEKGNTEEIRKELAELSLDDLEKGLLTDEQKLAFWLNIYNGYIQVILSEKPDLYKDRSAFFKKEQIPIAGSILSFEKIEHGIIRKSQWPLGLGYVRKWFPDKLERKLRVKKRDFRIHFALNCGAKDCPPVTIYTTERINEQLNTGTKHFLKSMSSYNEELNTVTVTSLFSWFRGDFGGKSGAKKILKENNIIPTTKGVEIIYKNYDWTLYLNNFIAL